jgi:hypothetical protein
VWAPLGERPRRAPTQLGGGRRPPPSPPPPWFKLRLAEDELAAIRERAQLAGLSASAWLRIRLAEVQVRSHPRRPRCLTPEALAELAKLASLGSLLNQLARREHYRDEPAEAVLVLAALRRTYDQLVVVRSHIAGGEESA